MPAAAPHLRRLVPLAAALALAAAATSAGEGTRWHRVDLDVTGDGRPEILLAREFVGAKAGDEFELLSPGPDGRLESRGALSFNPALGFRVDAERRRIVALSPLGVGEATRLEYAFEPRVRLVSSTRLVQDGAGATAYDDELSALEAFWAGTPKTEAFAEPVEGGEPVWRDVATGRPIAGLLRLDGQGVTSAPPWTPTLREHLLELRGLPSNWSADGHQVWLMEVDVLGTPDPETLVTTSLSSGGAGFLVYTREGDGYRFAGALPVRPGSFRIDPADRTIVADEDGRSDRRLVLRMTPGGVEVVRRSDAGGLTHAERQRERALQAAFAASGPGTLLAAPYAAFAAGEAPPGFTVLADGRPAQPATRFELRVANPGR